MRSLRFNVPQFGCTGTRCDAFEVPVGMATQPPCLAGRRRRRRARGGPATGATRGARCRHRAPTAPHTADTAECGGRRVGARRLRAAIQRRWRALCRTACVHPACARIIWQQLQPAEEAHRAHAADQRRHQQRRHAARNLQCRASRSTAQEPRARHQRGCHPAIGAHGPGFKLRGLDSLEMFTSGRGRPPQLQSQ